MDWGQTPARKQSQECATVSGPASSQMFVRARGVSFLWTAVNYMDRSV